MYLTLQTPTCSPTPCYLNGVIHSFWIPALNGKKDVVPGRQQFLKLEADKPGTFLGQCAEYCGLSHANMRMRVIARDSGRLPGLGEVSTGARPRRRRRC